ncbi:MAG: nucleoside-diphosphate kinase [Candidatus Aenigmarchaeota archaeon]|nr:nucleoside-diphosphate kinase [Candidatus Aenigmarchaeota archaeon]
MIERTLVLIKPDGVQRGLIGEVLGRFERRGLKIVGLKMVHINRDFAEKHYPKDMAKLFGRKTVEGIREFGLNTTKSEKELGEKTWEDLINFITESPVVAMVLEGVHAVKNARSMAGSTSPHEASPGTIRGDYAHVSMVYSSISGTGGRNVVHASGSLEDAKREIALWFKPEELHEYQRSDELHTTGR